MSGVQRIESSQYLFCGFRCAMSRSQPYRAVVHNRVRRILTESLPPSSTYEEPHLPRTNPVGEGAGAVLAKQENVLPQSERIEDALVEAVKMQHRLLDPHQRKRRFPCER